MRTVLFCTWCLTPAAFMFCRMLRNRKGCTWVKRCHQIDCAFSMVCHIAYFAVTLRPFLWFGRSANGLTEYVAWQYIFLVVSHSFEMLTASKVYSLYLVLSIVWKQHRTCPLFDSGTTSAESSENSSCARSQVCENPTGQQLVDSPGFKSCHECCGVKKLQFLLVLIKIQVLCEYVFCLSVNWQSAQSIVGCGVIVIKYARMMTCPTTVWNQQLSDIF